MLKQRPTLDITHSNQYKVHAQVDMVKFHFIQLPKDNRAELCALPCFESDAERLQFVDSVLADNKYLFPVAEREEGGERGPNRMQRVSKAANKCLASTFLPGGSNPAVYHHQMLSSGQYQR